MTRPEIPKKPVPPYPILIRDTRVVAGFGRGSSEIGIPTANIPIEDTPELETLPTGVYFGFIKLNKPSPSVTPEPEIKKRLDGKSEIEFTYGQNLQPKDLSILPMVMSLGWNPFFKNEKKACEIHIMHDFKSDFYGCSLSFNILGYLRPELDYVSVELLIKDIQTDIKIALDHLKLEEYNSCKKQLI
ncbi:hypothetical protein CANARDRAFT_228347 [[Candida] arabinofermentans NRRL YB-2248]|uniref:Riboflavin kinase n=1 Tax=[Candida] arabinofermentans NRRL YB-2248 TaxID=983967 RepID=A0A1E4T851_9ASCO|nr:hypothetical protein CANARDRAFT_228347 [[Candida] arabinofermentans NRRL YB-2248]